jgi:hypothetical protein
MKLDFINSEWIKRYCDMEITAETEQWERSGRPKNDGYTNGTHFGHTRALRDLKHLIERLEQLEDKRPGEK